ncbi:DNA-3-methyladenine glycosylase I [Candidatus Sneabacter namystus]|uniref:DNA-3-methyladenine glycosylase I n=1 Tax=Candidatus Sneabacter namystus TaxID=2601646 RepID=A0A5C0UHY1_9RICK|nr:DNA-3-methyladenine glycosylase I [Candidatus Sneabacter namystus]QEK39340.1 DNA-3-methyladenine glycosylase I [Candidatus Sneabacter namystus]
MTLRRCSWVNVNSPISISYHDNEWGIPVMDENKLFEMLILEGAQAGLSWQTILNRRGEYRKLFKQFVPVDVANMSDEELEELLCTGRIIRNRRKIFSARKNAKIFLEIQKEFGSFYSYVWNFVKGKQIVRRNACAADVPTNSRESHSLSKDLIKRGMSFIGPTIAYSYMQSIGLIDDHVDYCFKRASKMEQ